LLIDGYAFGSLSMTCYGLDARRPKDTGTRPSAGLPNPADTPAEDTNL
jgi:hypothetical protein